MFEVELDIYSGMPNPKWILSKAEEKELRDRITSESTQVSPVHTPEEEFDLGYRGLIVRDIKWNRISRGLKSIFPREFRVGSKMAKQFSTAEWLLKTSEKKCSKVTDKLREVAAKGVVLASSSREVVTSATYSNEGSKVSRATEWETCQYNFFADNTDVFNLNSNIIHNNCYAFASNHLGGGRYAHPGLHGGRPAKENTCSEVIAGLHADGWNHYCSPNSSDVLIIACVIWPGEDFHFYRLVSDGPSWQWAHKQGSTKASYRDNCQKRIEHDITPKNCCRGHYTDFCGYFYQNGPKVTVKSY
ncbi:hypothetical protein [Metabacillus iocasae]|uniref:Uncharacterized protein n=1 Tax=Priestia iocasae TaxID=2291674 RepID=A0ABS2QWT8_9BACI|nr:hypothetical protein [Metabacillus iocasae]MBM7703422.1 hypothetical protein [Metabacillus iocasae]